MDRVHKNLFAIINIAIYGLVSSNVDLYNKIFNNYNPNLQPFSTVNQPVHVEVYFSLIMISEVNEQKQTLKFRGSFSLAWVDDTIRDNMNGTSEVLLCDPNDVWTPDLGILNSATTFNVITPSTATVAILTGGLIRWNPEGLFTTTCKISPLMYPFDTQICDITISAWFAPISSQTMYLAYIDETFLQKTIQTLKKHTEWDLTDANQYCFNQSDDSPYIVFSRCTFTIQLERRSQYFVTHVLVPLIVMSLITPFAFLLTEASGERVSYGVTLFLSYSVFMQSVTEDLPVTSLEVSYFTVLAQMMFVLSGIQVVIVCILIRVRNSKLSQIISKLTCPVRQNKVEVVLQDPIEFVDDSTKGANDEENPSDISNSADINSDKDTVCWLWTYIDYIMFCFFFILTFSCIIFFIGKTIG